MKILLNPTTTAQEQLLFHIKCLNATYGNPPLGLFGCFAADRNLKWAVSIMPSPYGGNNWLHILILPVTSDFLSEKRVATELAASREQESQRKLAEQQATIAERARLETIRLAP